MSEVAGMVSVKKLQDVEAALLDIDGSCRDINFEGVTWVGVEQLINSLEQDFQELSAYDGDGNLLSKLDSKTIANFAHEKGFVQLNYNRGSNTVTHLQVFISLDDDNPPFVELTFFPQDLVQSNELKHDFIKWLNQVNSHLQSERYYCRYENASWSFGDTGPESGVFIFSK